MIESFISVVIAYLSLHDYIIGTDVYIYNRRNSNKASVKFNNKTIHLCTIG